ncbi:hypothetical protein [Halobacillus sp. H74]|uniref:hypothetical protein n=1 Tax=Halobacillus sp. H74 TaxID=3457436 RepID=UPI003FCC7005
MTFNWLLFLTGAYSLLPVNVADQIFVPLWWALCIVGSIAAINEFRNDPAFAIPGAALTTISFIFSLLAGGILQM